MAPYLVPEVINHSPAILPLGVFLHHNIADRRTVNITWSAHHEEGIHSLARRNLGIASSVRRTRFKFLASHECRDRLSCSGKEIDWRLSDYYSKHAARTFIPSKHIPRYDRWCQSKTTLLSERTSATRMGHNKSHTRCLVTLRTKCKLIGLMKTCSKFRNDQETEILTLLSGLHPRRNFTR